MPVVKPPQKVQEPPSRPARCEAQGTRSSGRTRAKCVNYNEDADEADFIRRTEKRVAPKSLHALASPATAPPLESPPLVDSTAAHPPIVLRISKASLSSCIARNNNEHR